jgi:monoamine oxidase
MLAVSKEGITRRRLFGAAAAGAAVSGATAAGANARGTRPRHVDVVVVGAGLAGLTAARRLVRAHKSVLVLEARDRVGGRTLREPIGRGKYADMGAGFIGPTQDHIAQLARELGVRTFKTYNEGSNVQYYGGKRSLYPASGLPSDPGFLKDLPALLTLDAMAQQVPVDEPWKAARADEWDSQTLETWKQANMTTPSGKATLDTAVQANWGAEPRDLSLLFVLFYIAAAGNERNPGSILRLTTTGGGAQETRFVGGTQLIALRLAKRLGSRVVLESPVRGITRREHSVKVNSDRVDVVARRVIVAIPPTLTAEIEYHPKMHARRVQLVQRYPQGWLLKCEAIYDSPFWRADGLSGQAVSDTGPATSTFDASPRDGTPGVLLGFVGGDQAREWGPRDRAYRRRGVLDSFARYFGDRALHPRRYVEMDWATEVWTRGCPVGFAVPGALSEYGRWIRKPIGRIHWAGTETSTYWNGYMDGAVRSGERAAREVLAKL